MLQRGCGVSDSKLVWELWSCPGNCYRSRVFILSPARTEDLEQIKIKCGRKSGRARLRPGLVFRPCTRPRQSAALPKRLQHFLNRSKEKKGPIWLFPVSCPFSGEREGDV